MTTTPATKKDLAPSILLVDDDLVFRPRLARALMARGLVVREASSYEEAVEQAHAESPELALVDLRLPGRSGLEVVAALKEIDGATNVVVLTGYGSIATALEAVRLGATHYLTKPVDVDEILAAFARAPDQPFVAGDDEQVPSLARVEWEHIHRVLTDCQGNISKASRLLGVHRRSLQRKLSKMPTRR
jgi:two-component system response regulator RegA